MEPIDARCVCAGNARLTVLAGVTAVVAAAVTIAALSGCATILGIDDTRLGFEIRGSAAGVAGPMALEVALGDRTELVTLTGDGPLLLAGPLLDGTSYQVTVRDQAPCTLEGATGVIAGADVEVTLRCSLLDDLALSGATAPAIELVAGVSEYAEDVSVIQQVVAVTATAALADTRIEFIAPGGSEVLTSGEPGAEQALLLGESVLELAVSHAELGWSADYRVTVTRGLEIAQLAYGKASNTETVDVFGTSVALSGDVLAVGTGGEDSAATGVNGNQADNTANGSGAVYVFRRSGTQWMQEAYLKASNTAASDNFGTSVALSGDVLAVGAPGEASAATGVNGNQADNTAADSGAVYVFRSDGSEWAQEAYLKASNTDAGDLFGISVALSGDTVAVGASGEDSRATGVNGDQADGGRDSSGAVYVFRRSEMAWAQEAYIKASNSGAIDLFGRSLALSGDTLAVGASAEDSGATGVNGDQVSNTVPSSGAVYVFRRGGVEWAQEAYIKASNTGAGDSFGSALALSGDTLAVGAFNEDSRATGVNGDQADDTANNSGAVYVFRRNGTEWAQEAYLKASNASEFNLFGAAVALSGDTLAVGATLEDSGATGVSGDQADTTAADSGAVYVFQRNGTVWAQAAYVKASNTGISDQFSASLALSGDTLAVGARHEDSSATGINGDQANDDARDSGAVYVFH